LQGGAAAEILTKISQKVCQTSIFEVMSEVKKDSEGISAGTGNFYIYPIHTGIGCKVSEVNFDLTEHN
jgi:hypothetical protein